MEHYLSVLERLFLVRRLPAWHRSPGRRLIRSPKVHFVDSGLAATLAALSAPDLATNRDLLGHLLESLVVQQLIAQAPPDLEFWHYRDKDQVEVDLVMTRGARTWGFEVKAGSSPSPGDPRPRPARGAVWERLRRRNRRTSCRSLTRGCSRRPSANLAALLPPDDRPQAARISRSAPSSAWWCPERPTEIRRKVGRPQPAPSWT